MACALMLRVQAPGRVERLPGGAVLHQFQAQEQAAAADIADMRMVAEALDQPVFQQTLPMARTLASRSRCSICCCTARAAAQAVAWPI